jgi:glycosyltransferase involved in cell wall biosynthesis
METIKTPKDYLFKVSIGMPVYNGEKFIREAFDSLLTQTFTDFELIISDNASTDATEAICREYAACDPRIRYVRQSQNRGPAANFKFVLDEAVGEYFMWAACDDTRSPDFLEVNFKFLSENPEYAASTSPNRWDGQGQGQQKIVDFALDGDLFERFIRFFDYCWVSHGIFYSLVRTDTLRGCEILGKSFIAADWAIILYIARRGKMNRCSEGLIIIGTEGYSNRCDAFKIFRNSPIELLLPFYAFSKITLDFIKVFSIKQRLLIAIKLAKVNLKALRIQLGMFIHDIIRAVRHFSRRRGIARYI